VRCTVAVRGRGRVQVAAYGVADAEHLVEKELTRLWPGARVRIERISRAGGSRIVEEFEVSYLLEGEQQVVAATPAGAPAAAFRHLRSLLSGSRYRKTEWEDLSARS
jgi:hypothetical protein